MKFSFTKIFILFLLATIIAGCGDDSNNSSQTISTSDDGSTYNLRDMFTKNNYSFSTNISSSNGGDDMAYTFNTTKQQDKIVNGINVSDILQIGSITNKRTGASRVINNSVYYNTDGIAIQSINNTDGTICTLSNNPSPFKVNSKIGDNGEYPSYDCTDNEKINGIWKLIKIGTETILEIVTNTYDSGNNLIITSTKKYFIEPSGTILKYSRIIYDAENSNTMTIPETKVNRK